jgi:hypothetical protein
VIDPPAPPWVATPPEPALSLLPPDPAVAWLPPSCWAVVAGPPPDEPHPSPRETAAVTANSRRRKCPGSHRPYELWIVFSLRLRDGISRYTDLLNASSSRAFDGMYASRGC